MKWDQMECECKFDVHALHFACLSLEWIKASETRKEKRVISCNCNFETYSIVLTAMVSLHHQLHPHRMVDMTVYLDWPLILDRHLNLFRYYRSLCVSYPLHNVCVKSTMFSVTGSYREFVCLYFQIVYECLCVCAVCHRIN